MTRDELQVRYYSTVVHVAEATVAEATEHKWGKDHVLILSLNRHLTIVHIFRFEEQKHFRV